PSVVQPSYNEAGRLERVAVWLRLQAAPAAPLDAATADTHALTGVDYNARGQRLTCAHGNGVVTAYEYDPETFRLRALTTTRPGTFAADARTVQALAYTYDPAGNVTRVADTADIQNVVFFRNQRVEPSADYTYDPLYRLKRATGREHLGQNGGALNAPQQVSDDDSPRAGLASPGDGNAMGNYVEQYECDPAGNILRVIHQVASGGWTRRYSYAEPGRVDAAETGDRLSATSLPGDDPQGPYSAHYAYDEHGNTTSMPHLPRLTWDAHDRLQSVTRQQVNSGMPETTFYFYDAGGERARKVTYRQASAGAAGSRKSERLYLGGLEIYREYDGAGALTLERETLHVMDDKRRVALAETLTAGQDAGPTRLVRYQHGNGLGSSALELDDEAEVVSYEEYFPFGATSYQAVRSQTEAPKRYRYTGKERDEESGLYYHGARYYAAWLGRWASCDPAGTADDINLYAYVSNRPTAFHDSRGTDKTPEHAAYFGEVAPTILRVTEAKGIPMKNARFMMIQAYSEQGPGMLPSEHNNRLFNAQPLADKAVWDKDHVKILKLELSPGQTSKGVSIIWLPQREVRKNKEGKDVDVMTSGPLFAYESGQRSVEHTIELFGKRYKGDILKALKDDKTTLKQYTEAIKNWGTETGYGKKVFDKEAQVTKELKEWLPHGIKQAEKQLEDLNAKVKHQEEVVEEAKKLQGIGEGEPGEFSMIQLLTPTSLQSAQKELKRLNQQVKTKTADIDNLKKFQQQLNKVSY
ncbi:MAG TPA: RHS repeat-associated core domain-containing protein, partial [Pyrinomonadaceae bacterium]|nr:RHS repeat-associated core domain-containing protein [Pyrinomonadaceae bacterium]